MRKCGCGNRLGGAGRTKAYSRKNVKKMVYAECGDMLNNVQLGISGDKVFVEQRVGKIKKQRRYFDYEADASRAFRSICKEMNFDTKRLL